MPRKSKVPGPPRVPKSRRSGEPGFWQCPRCVYRIALDFPSGIDDAIAAHWLGHTYPVELELSEKAKAWTRGSAVANGAPTPKGEAGFVDALDSLGPSPNGTPEDMPAPDDVALVVVPVHPGSL